MHLYKIVRLLRYKLQWLWYIFAKDIANGKSHSQSPDSTIKAIPGRNKYKVAVQKYLLKGWNAPIVEATIPSMNIIERPSVNLSSFASFTDLDVPARVRVVRDTITAPVNSTAKPVPLVNMLNGLESDHSFGARDKFFKPAIGIISVTNVTSIHIKMQP